MEQQKYDYASNALRSLLAEQQEFLPHISGAGAIVTLHALNSLHWNFRMIEKIGRQLQLPGVRSVGATARDVAADLRTRRLQVTRSVRYYFSVVQQLLADVCVALERETYLHSEAGFERAAQRLRVLAERLRDQAPA